MNLYTVLPDFPINDFSNIFPALERSHVSVSDLLTLEAPDIAKRAQIPVREVTRLTNAVLTALHAQYGYIDGANEPGARDVCKTKAVPTLARPGQELVSQWQSISTLDPTLDDALAGGLPLSYLTEITGESGAGKTQFLLTLCLAVQLPPTNRNALYVTTEAPLQTTRLAQIIKSHPSIKCLPATEQPALDRILGISTPDLESQEHILRYQVPVAIRRHNVGLVVIDSITANYRAEFDRQGKSNDGTQSKSEPAWKSAGASMAKRTAQLMAMGTLLRDLARTENIAVVVANQVADRFPPDERFNTAGASSSHPASRSGGHIIEPTNTPHIAHSQPHSYPIPGKSHKSQVQGHDPWTLNHQQNFFTGWGNTPGWNQNLKTPSLGLVWSNEIAARIAIIKSPARSAGAKGRWQRHMKVVFAPWAAPSEGRGVEIEITAGGVGAVVRETIEDAKVGAPKANDAT